MEKASFILRMVRIIKGLLRMVLLQVKEGIFIIMGVCMRVVLLKIRPLGMARIMTHFKVTVTKVNGSKMFPQDKESKNSLMAHIMKGNSKTE